MTQIDDIDPRGLFKDAYSIEGISLPECRSIFLDWAIAVPQDADARDGIRAVLDLYRSSEPDHPMTQVLQEGLAAQPQARRRGGRRARHQT